LRSITSATAMPPRRATSWREHVSYAAARFEFRRLEASAAPAISAPPSHLNRKKQPTQRFGKNRRHGRMMSGSNNQCNSIEVTLLPASAPIQRVGLPFLLGESIADGDSGASTHGCGVPHHPATGRQLELEYEWAGLRQSSGSAGRARSTVWRAPRDSRHLGRVGGPARRTRAGEYPRLVGVPGSDLVSVYPLRCRALMRY
jgi:hypothetical protein